MGLDSEKLKICVHCGLCLEACPTYRVLKNEADSPRGRILLMRGVAEKKIPVTQTVLEHLDACLDCRACETACPAGVPYGELIEEGRAELYSQVPSFSKKMRLSRFLLNHVLAKPTTLKVLSCLLILYQRSGLQWLIRKSGILNIFPHWIKQGESILPKIPRKQPSPSLTQSAPTLGNIALLRGCIASVLFPQVEEATVNVLQKLGYSVVVPPAQTCCGALLVHGGFKNDARVLAQKNMAAFLSRKPDFIAVMAAGCGSILKEYGRLFPDLPESKTFSEKVMDITELLTHLGLPEKLAPVPLRVAYQDACHLVHAQKIKEAPRHLLSQIPQLELLELPHSDWCCGSAGVYNLTHPEIASEILKEKIESILSVKPDVVAVGNPGCTLQIKMGLEEAKTLISVVHPIELLWKSLR